MPYRLHNYWSKNKTAKHNHPDQTESEAYSDTVRNQLEITDDESLLISSETVKLKYKTYEMHLSHEMNPKVWTPKCRRFIFKCQN